MEYKFQKLDVYKIALEYLDFTYATSRLFPDSEKYNLKSQLERAATSVVLNIAEASTGQSDAEQHRILGLSLRSYLETVACMDIALRRKYLDEQSAAQITKCGENLFIRLQALRTTLRAGGRMPT